MYKFIIDKMISARTNTDKEYSNIFCPFNFYDEKSLVDTYDTVLKELVKNKSYEYFKINDLPEHHIISILLNEYGMYDDIYYTILYLLTYNDPSEIEPIDEDIAHKKPGPQSKKIIPGYKYDHITYLGEEYVDAKSIIGPIRVFKLSNLELAMLGKTTYLDYVYCMHKIDKFFLFETLECNIKQNIYSADWGKTKGIQYDAHESLRETLLFERFSYEKICNYIFEELFYYKTIISIVSVLALINKTRAVSTDNSVRNIVRSLSRIKNPHTRISLWYIAVNNALNGFIEYPYNLTITTLSEKFNHMCRMEKTTEFLCSVEANISFQEYGYDIGHLFSSEEEKNPMYFSAINALANDMLFSLLEGMYFYEDYKKGTYTLENYMDRRKEFLEISAHDLLFLMRRLYYGLNMTNKIGYLGEQEIEQFLYKNGETWLNKDKNNCKLYSELFIEFCKYINKE